MEVIQALRNEGFDLWCDGENIHCRLRYGVQLNKENATRLLSDLKEQKAEAIRFLEACSTVAESQNGEPRQDMRTITVFSKVLGREVFVSWQGANPQSILFDGVAYTIDEIAKLKEMPLTPDDLRTIQETKKTFEGTIEG